MKGERGTWEIELFPYSACRKAFGTGLHEQAIDRQARALRQSAQCVDDLCVFHISRMMEMNVNVKTPKPHSYNGAP